MRQASSSRAAECRELRPAATKRADKRRIAALLRRSLQRPSSGGRELLRASGERLPATTADENQNRGRTMFRATPAAVRRLRRKPESGTCDDVAAWRSSHAKKGRKSSRCKSQRVRGGGGDGRIRKWQREGRAVIPVGPLVAIVRAERIARFAHYDVLR